MTRGTGRLSRQVTTKAIVQKEALLRKYLTNVEQSNKQLDSPHTHKRKKKQETMK